MALWFRSEYRELNHDETKACMTFSRSTHDRQFLILEMFFRWREAVSSLILS